MPDYRGRDVHFCATCVWIRHVKPHVFMCERLGYQTQPGWKFHCWSPRAPYRPAAWEETTEDRDGG